MKQLPPDTVRVLSSSQVITSVVSVVKELMENALDAGASSVDVKLENFGLDRVEVRDNGDGIRAEDAPVMAVRHFTSKISSHDDLERLETYGFRGEALGSICAVAEVSVTTKTEEEHVSTQYTLDPTGAVVSQRPSHLGRGTTVSVTKLFKKLPVRRQYYSSSKRCKEELRRVQDLLMTYGVLKPELRLMLVHNKVVLWQKAKVADARSALLAVLGSGPVAHLLPCHQRHEQPEIVLDGFFPKPGADLSSTSSSTPEKTFIFINKRPVQQKEVLKLLRQHYSAQYSDASAPHRYPTALLKVSVCPSSVDVNVTPDKTQLLLHNKEAVLTAVEALLVSLYGFRSGPDPAAEESFVSDPLPADSSEGNNVTGRAEEASHSTGSADVSLEASNCSSSSSVADDWIVSRSPAAPESCGAPARPSPSESPTSPDASAAETSRKQISAEDWSRGTALSDPTSGEPLRPVVIRQPSKPPGSDRARSPPKKTINAITEKRAALTAYDMISHRPTRAPLSPPALFDKETRAEVLREKPAAGLQDISSAVQERWKKLKEEDRKKYEEKAKQSLQHYEQKTKLASCEKTPSAKVQGQKRKAPPSNQQLLDELFSAQPQKKTKPSRPLPCSLAALRLRLQRLSSQKAGAAPRGLRLVKRLGSQGAWVAGCGQRLVVFNWFRAEEALLFHRLVEENIVPAVSLQTPLRLTAGSLAAELMQTLINMERQTADLSGGVVFSDPRLVSNGFKIKLTADGHLEVTAMADCVPFLGVEDLREILTAVLHRKASSVRECRPLKVTNYLQAEAVRLARQLPAHLSRREVEATVQRMERQLGESERTCIHGRPFLHHLTDVPSTDEEAKALFRPLEL